MFLSCRGFSQSQIARQVGLSQPQISRDLEEIDKIICPQDATERTKRRVRLLSKMRHAEKELWDAWDGRSKTKKPQQKRRFCLPATPQAMQERGVKRQKTLMSATKRQLRARAVSLTPRTWGS